MNYKLLKLISGIFLVLLIFSMPCVSSAQSQKDKKAAQKLVNEADKLYRKRDYIGSIKKFEEALKKMPVFPYAHFSKAYSHLKLNQNDIAINELSLALEQGHPGDEVYKLRWELFFNKNDIDSALRDVKEAQKLVPENPDFHIAEGRIMNVQGKYLEAIEKFDRAINLDTNDGNVYFYKAQSFYNTGAHAEQEMAARKALNSGGNCAGECWFLIGDYYQKERKYKDAITAYRTSISSSDVREAYFNLAETYRLLNEFSKAIEIANKGSQKFPDDVGLKIALVRYYSLNGNNDKAINIGEELISNLSSNATAFKNLCRAYSYKGQFFQERKANFGASEAFDKAIENCNKSLELEPDEGESQYYLGRTYQLKGNQKLSKSFYEKSLKGLEEFVDTNPDDADGYYILGNAYFTTSQYKKAVKTYEKSLEISPRFAEVILNLGYTYIFLDNMEKAKKILEKLRNLDAKKANKLKSFIDNT